MLVATFIIPTGAALAGLVGSVCRSQGRSWRAPLHSGSWATTDRVLTLAVWLGSLFVLLVATVLSGAGWAAALAVLPAALTRNPVVAVWLDRLDPRELVELKFAALLALLACGAGLGHAWDRRPPLPALQPGGPWVVVAVPYLSACCILLALLAAQDRSGTKRSARGPRAAASQAPAPANDAGHSVPA